MTAFASHRGMFPIEMKGEQGMIHLCIFPAFGRVTRCAVGSKLTVVMVVLRMAGETRLGCYLKISDGTRVDMALGTSKRRMFPDQIEWNFIMVKTGAVRLNAVMTSHAVCTECQGMVGGECRVNLEMTIYAGSLIERRSIAAYVAVLAGKRSTIRFSLVRSQLE